MKLRIANRALAVAVMAFVLAAVLTVSALAYSVDFEGKITDLEDGVSYTYAMYDFATGSYGTYNPLDANTALTSGLWGIKAGDADPVPLFVQGEQTGKINFWNGSAADQNLRDTATRGTYSPGKWTISTADDGAYSSFASTNNARYAVNLHLIKFLKYQTGTSYNFTAFYGDTSATSYKNATDKSQYWLLGADNKLQGSKLFYGFTNEQVVPTSIFEGFYDMGALGIAGNVKVNETYTGEDAKFTPALTLHIKKLDGTTDTYTLESDKAVALNEKPTFTLPEGAELPEGYIVGFDYAIFAGRPDDFLVAAKGDKLGATSQLNIWFTAGDIAFTIAPPAYPAPAGLSIEDGKVKGLVEGKKYQYTNLSVGDGIATETTPATLTGDTEVYGLIKVRESNDDGSAYTAWTPIIYSPDDEEVRQEFGTRIEGGNTDGYYQVQEGDVWAQGKWSGSNVRQYKSGNKNMLSSSNARLQLYIPTYVQPLVDAINAQDTVAEAAARKKLADRVESLQLRYAYENNEIIPVDEIVTFAFKSAKRSGGSLSFGEDLTAKVTFFVISPSGELEEYVWTEKTNVLGTNHEIKFTLDSELGWENGKPEEGWIVALTINPWTNVVPEDITLASGAIKDTYFAITINDYSIKLASGIPDVKAWPALSDGYGEITNLNSSMRYQFAKYDEETDTYGEWEDIPAGVTSFSIPQGEYRIRVAKSDYYTASEAVPIVVGSAGEFVSLENEVKKIHLPNDFVEVTADYEIDVTKKTWVAKLALDNMKTVAPESTIIIAGDGYKFVLKASDLITDKLNHYYNFAISFEGESRHDANYEAMKDIAGAQYVTEFFIESPTALPFENAQLCIQVDEKYEDYTLELRSLNESINKLRAEEETVVENGWAVFTCFENTYVILAPAE